MTGEARMVDHGCKNAPAIAPRATCARSDDGKWLAVLGAEPLADGKVYWHFVRWVSDEDGFWEHDEFWQDEGQNAQEVLTAFLANTP